MSADQAPLVSIILPTYNRISYLRKAVESVLRQTERNWELLVGDDGSVDETAAFLTGLGDARVRVFGLPHLGHPGKVRNAVLPHARGRYVAFLDSDDWWEEDKLASQLAAHVAHPECGWSYTWFRSVDDTGAPLSSQYQPARLDGMIARALLAGSAIVITPSVMVERLLLITLGGFDESLAVGSHLELFVRLAFLSPAVLVPRMLVIRRTHAGNYGRPFRESRRDIDRLFRQLANHAPSVEVRRMVTKRRDDWLVDSSNRQRVERRFGAAWSSLAAALPGGALSRAWWSSAAKTAIRMVLPGRPEVVDRE
jgi:glycosyltransferase involved in cell wall biosynthesis